LPSLYGKREHVRDGIVMFIGGLPEYRRDRCKCKAWITYKHLADYGFPFCWAGICPACGGLNVFHPIGAKEIADEIRLLVEMGVIELEQVGA